MKEGQRAVKLEEKEENSVLAKNIYLLIMFLLVPVLWVLSTAEKCDNADDNERHKGLGCGPEYGTDDLTGSSGYSFY